MELTHSSILHGGQEVDLQWTQVILSLYIAIAQKHCTNEGLKKLDTILLLSDVHWLRFRVFLYALPALLASYACAFGVTNISLFPHRFYYFSFWSTDPFVCNFCLFAQPMCSLSK